MLPLPLLLLAIALWGAAYVAARRMARPDVAEAVGAAGLLALATVGFFWQPLLTHSAWVPAGGGDLAAFLYPNYAFAAEHVRQGIFPLWNPHLYGGVPFAADIQSGLFYPPNLLLFLVAAPLRYEHLQAMVFFHFWLAGFGMYLCLRHTRETSQSGVGPMAAFLGAIAFEFSDLFLIQLGNLNLIAVAAWLPLCFLAFQRAIARHSWRWAVGAGVLLALATLAGHIQITLYLLIALGLYALWAMATRREWRFPLGALAVALVTMVGLSALLLIPTIEMSQQTPRAALDYPTAAQYSLQPAQLVGMLMPGFFGRAPSASWGPWDRVPVGYVGLLTLPLAALGLARRRDRLVGAFALIAGAALLLALGSNSVLHGWLYALVPPFDQMRASSRLVLLMDFGLAALAAHGLEALLHDVGARASVRRFLRPSALLFLVLLAVALPLAYHAMLTMQAGDPTIFQRAANAVQALATFSLLGGATLLLLWLAARERLRGAALALAAIALLSFDLFSLGSNMDIGRSDPTANYRNPQALAFLREQAGLNRIEAPGDVWPVWQPDSALLDGLYEVWGLYNPLTLADPTRYWQAASADRRSPRYSFLGVKYLLAPKTGGVASSADAVPVFDSDPNVTVLLNQRALPRALFVGEAIAVPNHDAAWQATEQPDFNPARQVVVEGLAIAPPATTPQVARLDIVEYGLHRVRVQVESDTAGFLVLSDAFYPGWRATVNGAAAPLYRANYAFRAVPVPAGAHEITFDFQPQSWRVGLAVSGVTALVVLSLLLWKAKSWHDER